MLDLSKSINLFNGDCLEVMDKLIEQGVKVDAIITDPPYGTTACKWDSIIPFDEMWERLNKLVRANGAIVLFGSEPFSSALRMSNIKNYKYDWVWDKSSAGNVLVARYQPLKIHELVHVFSSGGKVIYYPQYTFGHKDEVDRRSNMDSEEIAQAIVMHIYGVETIDIANALDVKYLNAYHAVVRKAHRALKIPFQISKKKSLGKMVFTYDEGLVREHYETLPSELKSLCGELNSDRLVVKSKLLKSEMYL